MKPEPATQAPVVVLGSFLLACCWHVPRLPLAGETLRALDLRIEPGGKGLNVAVGLRRLGHPISLLLGVGADEAAERLRQCLAAEDIDARHVHALAPHSGYGAGWIDPQGRNCIAVYTGANERLAPAHVAQAAAQIRAARLVYGQFETAPAAVAAAFELARGAGALTVLNPSPWQDPGAALRATAQVVLVNEAEAAALLGLGPLDDAHDLARSAEHVAPALPAFWTRHAARILVVTCGARGSLAWQYGQAVVAAPAPAVATVDTVGCGDAFAAALCDALCADLPLPEALRWANAAGAWTAARPGVLDALPRRGELAAWAARGG